MKLVVAALAMTAALSAAAQDKPFAIAIHGGSGEMFMRSVAAHDIATLVKCKGLAPQKAADEVLEKVRAFGGRGGVVVLGRSGEAVFSFTTEGMYRGFVAATARPEILIYR